MSDGEERDEFQFMGDDWKKRIYERLNELGYQNLAQFAATMPSVPFRSMVPALGIEIAPIQLERIMRQEAVATGNIEFFARDCLSRYLRQNFPDGWVRGKKGRFQAARAFASWTAALSLEPNEKTDAFAFNIWNALQKIAKTGWQAHSADDPILLEAFGKFSFDL